MYGLHQEMGITEVAIALFLEVLFLTGIYMMMIDVVIDPVALQGDKWFLGKIYYYDHKGYYFGVPLSNALGWGFVGS